MNHRNILGWLPLLAMLLACPHFAAAQTADEPQFPIASRLGLTPPPGMTVSTTFQGFEDTANNIYIRLVAMPEATYVEIEKSMTNQALKKQNITVEKREPFALPNAKGMLVVARQDAGNEKLRKWLLVAPVGGLTALVSVGRLLPGFLYDRILTRMASQVKVRY